MKPTVKGALVKDARAQAPRKPISLLGRLTWHLHNPLVALACIAALVISVRALPRGWDAEWNMILAKRFAGRPVPQFSDPTTGWVYVLRTRREDGFDMRVIDTEVESWDLASRMTQERPQDMLMVGYGANVSRRGMWYPSLEIVTREMGSRSFVEPSDFTAEERERAQALFLDWLRKSPTRAPAATVAERLGLVGSETVFRRHWPYVWRNLGTVAALGLLLLSVSGMPRYLRVWGAKRQLRRGRCGVCRYDLTDTQPVSGEVRCPECGAVWTLKELRRGHTTDEAAVELHSA